MTRTHSYQSSSTAFSSTRQHLKELADPFGASDLRRSMRRPRRSSSITALPDPPSNFLRSSSNYHQSYSLPPSRQPSPVPTIESQPATLCYGVQHQNDLPNLLAVLTSAINAFTFHSSFSSPAVLNTLNLSSPTVMDVRCPQIPDRQYIQILSKIFPSALVRGESLFSALAAWIIIDLHLCKAISAMRSRRRRESNHNTDAAFYLSASGSLPNMTHQQQHYHPQIHRKPLPTQKQACHHYSYSTIINQSNSSLHRIPTKARDLLGITLSPPPHRGQCATSPHNSPSQHDTALLHRTIAVQQSVSVIGQKLVEALRGASGFDEDVWRGLRVLIEVVEEGGWARAGVVRVSEGERGGEWF